jgi:hypothetical protein
MDKTQEGRFKKCYAIKMLSNFNSLRIRAQLKVPVAF